MVGLSNSTRRRTVKAVAALEGGNRESVGEGDRQGMKERARRTEEQSQAGGKFHERKTQPCLAQETG